MGRVGSRKPGILAGRIELGHDFHVSSRVQEVGDINESDRVGSRFPWVEWGPGSRGY